MPAYPRLRGKWGFIPGSCMAGGGSCGLSLQLGFAPVRIAPEAPTCVSSPGTIEIEFAGGARMRITGAADAATLMAVVGALANGRRR